jgi:hypothetical protein
MKRHSTRRLTASGASVFSRRAVTAVKATIDKKHLPSVLLVIYGLGGMVGLHAGGAWASRNAARNERLQLMAYPKAGSSSRRAPRSTPPCAGHRSAHHEQNSITPFVESSWAGVAIDASEEASAVFRERLHGLKERRPESVIRGPRSF